MLLNGEIIVTRDCVCTARMGGNLTSVTNVMIWPTAKNSGENSVKQLT